MAGCNCDGNSFNISVDEEYGIILPHKFNLNLYILYSSAEISLDKFR